MGSLNWACCLLVCGVMAVTPPRSRLCLPVSGEGSECRCHHPPGPQQPPNWSPTSILSLFNPFPASNQSDISRMSIRSCSFPVDDSPMTFPDACLWPSRWYRLRPCPLSLPALSFWGTPRLCPSARTRRPCAGLSAALPGPAPWPSDRGAAVLTAALVHGPRAHSPACLRAAHLELQGLLTLLTLCSLDLLVVLGGSRLYLTFNSMFVSIRPFLVELLTIHFSP